MDHLSGDCQESLLALPGGKLLLASGSHDDKSKE
jgi:hypothetical protein